MRELKKNIVVGASREAAGRWKRKRPTDEQLIANIYKAPLLKCTVQQVFALSNGDLQAQCVGVELGVVTGTVVFSTL